MRTYIQAYIYIYIHIHMHTRVCIFIWRTPWVECSLPPLKPRESPPPPAMRWPKARCPRKLRHRLATSLAHAPQRLHGKGRYLGVVALELLLLSKRRCFSCLRTRLLVSAGNEVRPSLPCVHDAVGNFSATSCRRWHVCQLIGLGCAIVCFGMQNVAEAAHESTDWPQSGSLSAMTKA